MPITHEVTPSGVSRFRATDGQLEAFGKNKTLAAKRLAVIRAENAEFISGNFWVEESTGAVNYPRLYVDQWPEAK